MSMEDVMLVEVATLWEVAMSMDAAMSVEATKSTATMISMTFQKDQWPLFLNCLLKLI